MRIYTDSIEYDRYLLFIVIFLAGIGMVMLYSASSAIGNELGDSEVYLKGHMIRLVLGFGLLALTMRIDYSIYKKLALPMLIIASLVLFGGLIIHRLWGTETTARWIYLGGMSFQTSEFMKFALIVYTAYYLERKRDMLHSFSDGLLPIVIVLAVTTTLILKQPDFSTSVMLVSIITIMLFIGQARPSHLSAVGSIGGLLMVLTLFSSDYQIARLKTYLDGSDVGNAGYQIQQSLLSLSGGGILGVGLGESVGKNLFLPTPHTDFILAIIGEEMGFIGIFFIEIIFLILLLRGIKIARNASDRFGMYLAVGISASIFLYAMVNSAVVSGLLPVTGLPMPLISYGGSNILYTLGATGVLINISSRDRSSAKRKYGRSCD